MIVLIEREKEDNVAADSARMDLFFNIALGKIKELTFQAEGAEDCITD